DGTAKDASDYTAIPDTTLTFAPGETTKTISVLVNGDTTVESNETMAVQLSGLVGAVFSHQNATGTIKNDDNAVVTVADVSQNEGNSGTTAFKYTATIPQPADRDLTVNFMTQDGTATSTGPNPDFVAR